MKLRGKAAAFTSRVVFEEVPPTFRVLLGLVMVSPPPPPVAAIWMLEPDGVTLIPAPAVMSSAPVNALSEATPPPPPIGWSADEFTNASPPAASAATEMPMAETAVLRVTCSSLKSDGPPLA